MIAAVSKGFLRGKKAFGLIELLVVLVIIAVLSVFSFEAYFKKPVIADKASEQIIREQGINTVSYPAIVPSVKAKLKEAADMDDARMRQLEEIKY